MIATYRITPTAYSIVTANSLQVNDPNNMYADTDSTDAATILSLRNGTTSYLYLYGFDFSILPSDAVVQDIQIKIKGKKTANTSGNQIYAVQSSWGQSISSVGYAPAFSNSTAVLTFSNAQGSVFQQWDAIRNAGTNFGLYIDCGSSSWTQNTTSIYGAEVAITFISQSLIPVTGVELDIHSATFEEGQSITLTPTISPSDAADKRVTWSSSNTDVAVVNNGVVEAGFEQTGTAVITVTTNDGGFTDQCTVTVTQGQPQLYIFIPGSGLIPGEKYIIGTIDEHYDFWAISSESGPVSRVLQSCRISESSQKIYSVDPYNASKIVFECRLMDESNPLTTVLVKGGKYLYIDSSGGLQMKEASSVDRFWHYIDEHDDGNGAFWEFRSTSSNGYNDTSSEYKNYIKIYGYMVNEGFTDGHLTQGDPPVSQALGYNGMIPIQLLTPYTIPEKPYLKVNGNWEECSGIYKKESGVWVDYSTNISAVFDPNQNYIKV